MEHPIDIEKFVVDLFTKNDTGKLFYHNLGHSLEVVKTVEAMSIAEKLSDDTSKLLKLAAYLHDVGYLFTYHGHEDKGIAIAQECMPLWGFDKAAIELVCSLIEATKLSHRPQNQLEAIISDADLAYGVTHSFFERGPLLRKEWGEYLDKTYSEWEWETLQLDFLSTVQFHSNYGKTHFQGIVQENIKKQQIRVSALEKE